MEDKDRASSDPAAVEFAGDTSWTFAADGSDAAYLFSGDTERSILREFGWNLETDQPNRIGTDDRLWMPVQSSLTGSIEPVAAASSRSNNQSVSSSSSEDQPEKSTVSDEKPPEIPNDYQRSRPSAGYDADRDQPVTVQLHSRRPYDRVVASKSADQSYILSIRNLDFGVDKNDLEDLFQPLGGKKVTIFYHADGKSTGRGEITFESYDDAKAAIEQYDNVTLDGRVMHLKLENPPPSAAQTSFVRPNVTFASRGERSHVPVHVPAPAPAPRGGSSSSNSSNSNSNSSSGKGRGKPVSSADLDDDLDSYFKANREGGEEVEESIVEREASYADEGEQREPEHEPRDDRDDRDDQIDHEGLEDAN